MNRKLINLASWLKKNFFLKESKKVIFISKIASLEDIDKFFSKFQKLETMFIASEKSEDEGSRTEGQLARRMAERLKNKFQEKTGRNFDDAYAEWKQSLTRTPEESIGSRYEKYDWRNYYNEMDEILRDLGFFASQEHPTPGQYEILRDPGFFVSQEYPTPGQYEARLDHIVKDYISGTLPRQEAVRLLGEGGGEWLDEMASEMRAEMAISREWAAEQREAAMSADFGHPSWMSPNELREMEEARHYADWRNHVDPWGIGGLLSRLNKSEEKSKNQPGLVRSKTDSLIRIKKSPYSKDILVKRKDLLEPDVPRDYFFYGVTKLEYAKEYMKKLLDEIIFSEDDSSSFNRYMDELAEGTGDLFFRFQDHESAESVGGNELLDYLRGHLNSISIDIAEGIKGLNNFMLSKLNSRRYNHLREKAKISSIKSFKHSFDYHASPGFGHHAWRPHSNRIKILLRYLNDAEEESAGRPISTAYRALLISKYPHAYNANNLENIYKELYEYAVPLYEKMLNENEKMLNDREAGESIKRKLKKDYSEFLKTLKDKYKNTFDSCLSDIHIS